MVSFIFNTIKILLIYRHLQNIYWFKRGLHIPEEVCVCCVSGTTLCTLVHPTITAVEQPVEQMAAEACRLLMAKISDSDKQVEDVVLRGEIVERESTVNRVLQ